ncbi:putative ribonuclease H-like domain-containing protein [Tanacetum coccineum]
MQEELLQFKLQKVWVHIDLPYWKKVIGTKWFFRNKRDERSIVVKNKARLVAQGFRQEKDIDYDEVFVHVARIEAIRLFLAFASYMGFTVYQMDVKSAFLYNTIEEEVYVHQPPGFVDPAHPNKSIKRGLQVKQQPDGIFISQDKYVADILKKFDFLSIRTATTPIESNKPLVKDEDGIDVDVHVYRRLISWQCKKQTIVANSTTKAEYVAAANCCGQVLWIQNQMMDYGFNFMNTKIHIDNESTISVIKNPVAHSRTKHIEIRFHFIRDCYEKRLIEVIKIHTDHNVADLLTKGFDVTRISMDLRMDRSCAANSTHIWSVNTKYALTHNPTIYDSLVKQFWQTATVRTLANGTQQLVASIDSKEYTITEASVRSKLQLADATGIHNLSDAEIYAGLATLGSWGWEQFAEPHPTPVDPLPSTSLPPNQSPPHSPHQSPPHSPHQSPPHSPHQSPPHSPHQSPPHSPHQSPPHSPHQSPPHSSPPRSYEAPLPEGNTSGSAEASIQLKELMVLVPSLVTKVTSLEKELKDTKQTLWNVILKLVKKVKSLEKALKRKSKKVIVSTSEESMKEKSTNFVTLTKALGEAQEKEEEISPTILEAAKTLSKVASQSVSKAKSTDKGKRYRRRARSMAKKINTELDAEDEINTGRVEINSGIEDVNTGSSKVDTGRTSISTSSIIHSPKKGQREGKAQMVEEDIQATHKTKEQIRQEEAGLEEAIRLQAQMDEEVAKQIHLDKMLAKRVQEEQELSEQQLKRKAEVQKAAQFYTEEDWDTIRAKLEANTEVVKSLQGESISNDDFAKRMVEMINEKKKFYAEQKAKAKRSKPMTQAQQREYMSTFIKNQSSWKLSQLKKLSFEELKTEFEKLMKSIESFVPMETEARVKRHGLQLEQETSKKQKIDIEDASITKGKDEVVKEEETEVPVKKTGMRRKQKARKGINIDKTAQDEFNKEREAYVKDKVKDASSESEIGVDVIPTATKPPTIVNWKIISQSSQKAAYQIIRKDGSDKIYMSFGAYT